MTMEYRNIDAKKESFFKLSEEYGSIASFRRILSLLRLNKMEKVCETIAIREANVSVDGMFCKNKIDLSRQCNSCFRYIKQMRVDHSPILKDKKCTKFFFLDIKIPNGKKIDKEEYKKNLIGYCIVHQDTLIQTNGGREKEEVRYYVPECILTGLVKDQYGTFKDTVILDGNEFTIDRGIYFAQQNGYTNCCAHAAIKTALRGYDKDISCDAINNFLVKDKPDIKKQAILSRVSKGLRIQEMITVIKGLSKKSDHIDELDPIQVSAHDLPITSFIETIYRAIESKIPVILLLRIPKKEGVGASFDGHAVSLIGHTFNENDWNAYGSGYFSDQNVQSFLSSYLWCDNYVIQDDNFGPAYQISCSFLADYYNYAVTLEKINLNISSNSASNKFTSDYPLAALIIPPKGLRKLTENLHEVERIAATFFVEQVNIFATDRLFTKLSVKNKELFDRYFYYIFKNNLGNRKRTFICRTILVSKNEYLSSKDIQNIYSDHIMCDSDVSLVEGLGCFLPDYFWLTEISVPELFWINHAKIGEIITDREEIPDIEELEYNEKKKDSILKSEDDLAGQPTQEKKTNASLLESIGLRLIRLPYLVCLFPKGDDNYYPTYLSKQANPHQPMLEKKEGIIRQYKKGK
ncbi:hypothetical protein JWG39_10390 [Desulforhopalus vacuolatus]|uniref:hypothetical protein n=1 Tax=Desulforhopalus vacuolatus TaxID=40414 RepID=UPI0019653C7C|nr:hypothetical protein [Desulforhopalus vacuolatus]MBM9520221.1 hypothetical protein [Desulforhopalus vacuolatus]